MQIKRFEAASTQEALLKIKNELGPDAVVLSTRKLRSGRVPLFEVTAAVDERPEGRREKPLPLPAGTPRTAPANAGSDEETLACKLRRDVEEIKSLLAETAMRPFPYGEFQDLKEMLETFFDTMGFQRKERLSGALLKIYHQLVSIGVSRARAFLLVSTLNRNLPPADLHDEEGLCRVAEKLLARSIGLSYRTSERRRICAFVGPTGAGKTTTLAKIAARSALEEKLKVGLVTTDTYRIAAVEQLKTYARIMEIPIEVVSDKTAFRRALAKLSDRDLVLVDTPGKSFVETGYIERLRDLFQIENPMETNLLLPLTSSQDNLAENLARFKPVGYQSIIFTKLDESRHFGMIYNVIDQERKPVSWVTNGQKVPQDIEKIDAGRLAKIIMTQTLH
ncbi:MAG TPA: flagellar biosynthesis protein FlhF [Syntrophales bacterium]|nr:flagellar biosynthesis protein FlhF [Syntrophales bacterium]